MGKYSGLTLGQVEALGNIFGGENAIKTVLADTELASKVHLAIKNLLASTASYLIQLFADETIMLPATKGSVMLADCSEIFPGWLDSDLVNWQTNKRGKNTRPQKVRVLEQSKDGKLRQMFESIGSVDRLCMSQGQIAQFCVTHRDKLRQEGWGTFFLFKVGAEYFVAFVFVVADGRLGLFVYRLGFPDVWIAQSRDRVVVPQLDA